MRTVALFLSLVVAGGLVGCSQEQPAVQPPPLVKVFTVGEPLPARNGPGETEASPIRTTAREARADLAGEIMEVLVKPGQVVMAGQALVRIDPRDARLADSSAKLQVQAARAELASAEADFARYTNLREKSFISQAEWERRSAALSVTRAQFEATLDRLGVSTVRALAPATVTSVSVRVGETVEASQLLARLQPSRAVSSASASVAENVVTQAGPGLQVPLTALLEGEAVMKIEASAKGLVVRRQVVRVGVVKDREAQILDGLQAGDRVVAVGGHLLADGQAVRVAAGEGR